MVEVLQAKEIYLMLKRALEEEGVNQDTVVHLHIANFLIIQSPETASLNDLSLTERALFQLFFCLVAERRKEGASHTQSIADALQITTNLVAEACECLLELKDEDDLNTTHPTSTLVH